MPAPVTTWASWPWRSLLPMPVPVLVMAVLVEAAVALVVVAVFAPRPNCTVWWRSWARAQPGCAC